MSQQLTRYTDFKRVQTMQELSNLMPETVGINFFSSDPDLSFILKRHLSTEDYERAESILTKMGAVASQKMDSLAEEANRRVLYLCSLIKRENVLTK